MPLPSPILGFDFRISTASLIHPSGAITLIGNGPTRNASGVTINGTGHRLTASLSEFHTGSAPTWPITLHIRAAFASGSQQSYNGIQKANGVTVPRGTYRMILCNSLGTSIRGTQNNNAGTGENTTTSLGDVVKGTTFLDFSNFHDVFMQFDSGSNSCRARINMGSWTNDANNLGTVAAPSYASATLCIGSSAQDVANPRMLVTHFGWWNFKLTDEQCDEIHRNPSAAYFTPVTTGSVLLPTKTPDSLIGEDLENF